MKWTAILPLKGVGRRKTRLTGLDDRIRDALAISMARHVHREVARCNDVERTFLLTPERPAFPCNWIPDHGEELNSALDRLRHLFAPGALLVINPDLPHLRTREIEQLIGRAERAGVAIAPDRYGTGTNAVAVRANREFRFRFGPGSRHAYQSATPSAAILSCPGFGGDIDTIAELKQLLACEPGGNVRSARLAPASREVGSLRHTLPAIQFA